MLSLINDFYSSRFTIINLKIRHFIIKEKKESYKNYKTPRTTKKKVHTYIFRACSGIRPQLV